ncbi:hypothetical protein FDECE_17968 [Fusarium decemcellulare]|nr:hypothetical protein FDECE_17968 [Fusarium decemcellulare]
MSEDNAPGGSEAARTARKRKRIAHACEPCRQRKSRCDGSRPSCDLCKAQDIECFYRDGTTKPMPVEDRVYYSRLETRLVDIETMLHSLVESDNRRNAPSSVPSRGNDTEEEATDIQTDVNIPKESPNAAQIPRPTETQDSVDGMASITFADETSSGFFGPTSNSAFLQVLLEAQACIFRQRGTASSSLSSNNPNPTSLSRPSSPPTLAGVSTTPADLSTERGSMSASSGNPYIIPPQHKILRLIDIFFENTGKFFPYLYKPDIIKFVTNMRRSGFKQVEGAQLCLLNLIMAFAVTHSTFSLPVSVKKERGDVFLERALALLPHVKATADSLEPSMFPFTQKMSVIDSQ